MELQESIYNCLNSLQKLHSLEALKKLFWSHLNYDRESKPLSRRGWNDRISKQVLDDPLLLATGGKDFRVIYTQLKSEYLSRQQEREVVNSLLQDNPYALFIFSNQQQSQWRFLNVKYDETPDKRKLFRRITVSEGEQLRTALIAPKPQGGVGAIRDEIVRKYREAKALYMRAHQGGEKKKLEEEITNFKTEIALLTHGGNQISGFDWAVEFAEVIADGGFDIIVANPPYVRMELFKDIKPTLKKNFPEVHSDRVAALYGL